MRETKLWSWHILAGVFLFVLLGAHMCTMHLDEVLGKLVGASEGEVLSFGAVADRAGPAMGVFYLLFAGAALYHGLYGLRNILCELTTKESVKKALGSVITVVGVVLFAYGAYAAVASASL
ncbi:MAG: hypothetical protein COY42_19630 [Armatimonadetes bacterium CG_4_10_14_0_8_um_filter_66_14]|nr:hypothetical protein [Armatimonadota bacterium]OIP10755.1 MAG: hypothetical protein AUJ96_03470 [Armatimonadetes bacterium CG2_30_66_41]PIU94825.1 MAG: hypothetical protein COS65_05710 [Armatimonadetes bacterium CG06_land_8_20_14_3_00_66_21]PIX36771.1 MAG: hypothetical protein COZ57_37875 [Armatimonadetes bacterium CG_4_8_14_3_um_filter_66_20]PIZ41258.1 MAG: hypothetical protein COY42_19630 [Armatimonadetes bacterium CG_4_10_14_0_8_um_filter_66_14]